MTLPPSYLTSFTHTLRVILASKRFGEECLTSLLGTNEVLPLLCHSTSELLEGLRHQTIEILMLDVALLQQQTQDFCWRIQNLYPHLKIVLVGHQASELANYNWVYEFPDISTACLSPQPESLVISSESAMPSDRNPGNSPFPLSSPTEGSSYTDLIVGAAIFDLNGLPREYLITGEVNNMSWVQTIFQALGLRSLLMSSLQLEGFHHATIHSKGYCAIIVKQKTQYTALLVRVNERSLVTRDFIQWAQNFEPDELRYNPQFHVA